MTSATRTGTCASSGSAHSIRPRSSAPARAVGAFAGDPPRESFGVARQIGIEPDRHVETVTKRVLRRMRLVGRRLWTGAGARICWHMNQNENHAMWSCYTKPSESIAVKTTYAALREELPQFIQMGMVRYLDYAAPVEAMAHRLKTPEGRKVYALRKQTPEPVFGIIKAVLGFRQFSLRGLDKVRGEWNLVTMAWNMKRMFALTPA